MNQRSKNTAMTYPQLWFTYGPRTTEDEIIQRLIEAGATGARLTFSYGSPELQAERAMQIRRIAESVSRKMFIVADLQGEKCRIAKIEDRSEIPVTKGVPFLFTKGATDVENHPFKIPLQIAHYVDDLKAGDVVIEGDGALMIDVLEQRDDSAVCVSKTDGYLHPGRGIIVQKAEFRPSSITTKDLSDLNFIAECELFDAVAISFVGTRDDVLAVRKHLGVSELHLIAKIETHLGVANLEEICAESDAVMAARGDLALTMPWEDLYKSVSTLSTVACHTNKPWILATQLAEGLERFSIPTRAEICDLAHWMSAGAYGAMLSYETAFGPRAVEALAAVSRIVKRYCR